MELEKNLKRVETDPSIIELIKEILRLGSEEGDNAKEQIAKLLKDLEKFLPKAQIDMLLKKLRKRISWDSLTEREKAEILGNLPPA